MLRRGSPEWDSGSVTWALSSGVLVNARTC
jgi:hypothetical protein